MRLGHHRNSFQIELIKDSYHRAAMIQDYSRAPYVHETPWLAPTFRVLEKQLEKVVSHRCNLILNFLMDVHHPSIALWIWVVC
jgi:hypothetical protein